MLILTIKEGGYVKIGDHITVQFVQDLSSKSIRLGIEAPKSMLVARDSVYEKTLNDGSNADVLILDEIKKQKEIGEKSRKDLHEKKDKYRISTQKKLLKAR